jgi:8-oxo-dGTP pyrophosphatase MutT (NUDIX family)
MQKVPGLGPELFVCRGGLNEELFLLNLSCYYLHMAFALIIPQIKSSDTLAFQRRDNKAPTDPNVLGLFGGSIEEGETPLEGAFRELAEETSLHVVKEDFQFLAETSMPTTAGDAKVYLFTVQIPNTPFEVYEGDGYELYTKSEFLKRNDISKGAAHLLREMNL